jgi:very-short-patch-repair endonuclease
MSRLSPQSFAQSNGGAASVRAFGQAGHRREAIGRAVDDGRLFRVRPGWYAAVDAPAEVGRAVRVGGALTGASVVGMHGLWLLADPALHVRVPPTASRLRSPADARARLDPSIHDVCVHYRSGAPALGDLGVCDGLTRSIAEMFRCAGTVPAMVALESALNRGVLSMHAIDAIRAMLPEWARRPLELATPNSDSGLETIARMLLHRNRAEVRTQVWIEGVRRVDLLVGDRLVLELDGRAFHSGRDFERDREQDLELHLRGYLVVRLSYRMETAEWDRTHRAVLALVARELHRWGRVARPRPPFESHGAGNWAVGAL